MKYKYYNLTSQTKEAVGVVKAESLNEAYNIAAKTKQLTLVQFKKLFEVEQL